MVAHSPTPSIQRIAAVSKGEGARAESLEARAITTEKDLVRLPADLAKQVEVLAVQVVWHDPAAIDRLLAELFYRV